MKLLSIKKLIPLFLLTAMICIFPFVNASAGEAAKDADEVQQTEKTVKSVTEKKNGSAKKTKKPAVKKATVKINRTKVSLKKNRTTKLSAIKTNAPAKKIVWSSNKKKVATVDQQGRITAEGKGTAVITAKVQGTNIKDTCKVEVQNYKVMKMRITGYCNCRSCAGKWAGQPTASGRMPRANHTIAVDKRLIKLGTKVQIGNKIYTAEDTGGAIKGHRIDIYYSSHRKATRQGVKYKLVKVFY